MEKPKPSPEYQKERADVQDIYNRLKLWNSHHESNKIHHFVKEAGLSSTSIYWDAAGDSMYDPDILNTLRGMDADKLKEMSRVASDIDDNIEEYDKRERAESEKRRKEQQKGKSK